MIYKYANFCLHTDPYIIIMKVLRYDSRFTKSKFDEALFGFFT